VILFFGERKDVRLGPLALLSQGKAQLAMAREPNTKSRVDGGALP